MPIKPKHKVNENPIEMKFEDLFGTPRYATELLIPFIPKNSVIWECASGEGRITKVLEEHKYCVFTTDIRFNPDWTDRTWNFLDDEDIPDLEDNTVIITNPPFSLKRKFFNNCLSYGFPFALLIPADLCGWLIDAIRIHHCQKLIPNRRISYITPDMLNRINRELETNYSCLEEVPKNILPRFTSSMFHSMWLCKGFNLPGQTETFVDLSLKDKENIL